MIAFRRCSSIYCVHQTGAKALEEKLVQKLPGATSGRDVWHAALRLLSAFLSKSLISIQAASAPSISVPLSCFDVVLIYLRKSQICVFCKRKSCENKPSPEPLMCTDPGSQNMILGFIWILIHMGYTAIIKSPHL